MLIVFVTINCRIFCSLQIRFIHYPDGNLMPSAAIKHDHMFVKRDDMPVPLRKAHVSRYKKGVKQLSSVVDELVESKREAIIKEAIREHDIKNRSRHAVALLRKGYDIKFVARV